MSDRVSAGSPVGLRQVFSVWGGEWRWRRRTKSCGWRKSSMCEPVRQARAVFIFCGEKREAQRLHTHE